MSNEPNPIVSHVSECNDCHFRMEWDDEQTAEERAQNHSEREGYDAFTYTNVSYTGGGSDE